jgi:hypothetical protein
MLGDTQRLLTTTEIADFLARHPLIALQVAATNAAVATLGYDQIYTPPAWYEIDVRIPGLIQPNGICIPDSTYGNVLIAPSANGTLYYNAFVDSGACGAAQQDWTGYQPPVGPPNMNCPGWSNIQSLNDFFACLGSAATLALIVGGLWVGSEIYKNVKR